jgi:phosphoglycolate phosphatase
VLSKFQGEGFGLACATNKPEAFTVPLLRKLGLSAYFDQVVSGDSLSRKKPDPMPLRHICRRFGVAHTSVVMVGDSISDIHAARAASMPVICVSYGYNQGLDLTKARPDAIIDSFSELPDLIQYLH